MNAMKNLVHAGILLLWGVLGLVFTLKTLFAAGPLVPHLMEAGSWWLWFAGFGGVTTLLVGRFEKALSALLVHGAAFMVLTLIPKMSALAVFRLGIDLLNRA